MTKIRVRLSINLNANQVVDLDALRPIIERAVAAHLPSDLAIDTVRVTRINEAAPEHMPVPLPATI